MCARRVIRRLYMVGAMRAQSSDTLADQIGLVHVLGTSKVSQRTVLIIGRSELTSAPVVANGPPGRPPRERRSSRMAGE